MARWLAGWLVGGSAPAQCAGSSGLLPPTAYRPTTQPPNHLATFLAALLLLARPAGAARLMPFLARDAVVRESRERFPLAERGKPGPVLVLGGAPAGPRQAFEEGQVRAAGAVLAHALERIAGVHCVVTRSPAEAQGRPRVLVGPMPDGFPELAGADAHGFLVATRAGPAGPDLYLAGASGTATLYAAWFFLMNYAGARVALPGEIGEVYPRLDRLEVPRDLYVFNRRPEFRMRLLSGPAGFDRAAWLADTEETQRFRFQRNLERLSDPGTPPALADVGSALRAADYAGGLFRARPDLLSAPLSPNGAPPYGEGDLDWGRLRADGSLSLSSLYYEHVARAARIAAQRRPDRMLALAPAGPMLDPPEAPLPANVLIFLRDEPKARYAAWQGKAEHFGLWLPLYGAGWVLPNHWPAAMQECLQWAHGRGIEAFAGDAYPAWANDGPKLWVLCNLLWNADADVKALLQDYYEHAYGKEAAPAMARYFAAAEGIYNRRKTRDEYAFGRRHPGEYQFEKAGGREMKAMSDAITEAVEVARGEANRKRVDVVSRCFRWGALYWQQRETIGRIRGKRLWWPDDVPKALGEAQGFYELPQAREAYYRTAIEPLAPYCVTGPAPGRPDARLADPGFQWPGLEEAMDRLAATITDFERRKQTPQQVALFWEQMGQSFARLRPFTDSERLRLLSPRASLRNLVANGSFEDGGGPNRADGPDRAGAPARGWSVRTAGGWSPAAWLDRDGAHAGRASLTVKGRTAATGVAQGVRLANRARYRLSFWYRTSPRLQGAGFAVVGMEPPVRAALPPQPAWTRVERVFSLSFPDGDSRDAEVLLTLERTLSRESQVWFDDVRLERLAPGGAHL